MIKYNISFNTDGSVSWKKHYEKVLLAAPKDLMSSMEKYERNDDTSGDYDSFSVRVSFLGKAYIIIGGSEYQIGYDSKNVPTRIFDYG